MEEILAYYDSTNCSDVVILGSCGLAVGNGDVRCRKSYGAARLDRGCRYRKYGAYDIVLFIHSRHVVLSYGLCVRYKLDYGNHYIYRRISILEMEKKNGG